MVRLRRILFACLLATTLPLAMCSTCVSDDYLRTIKPLLRERCFACHGALKQESGLRVDTVAAMFRGGSSGPALAIGEPGGSELFRRVSSSDPSVRMPPEGRPLSAEEVGAIESWLKSGAVAPPNELPEPDPLEHWAFRSPVRTAVPPKARYSSSTNPIDAFINARLEAASIQPLPRADRNTLLRRAWLDLLGVPPTPEDLQQFLADDSPDAFDKVVDQLLQDPRYGERWARHWMDVWRYSDWYGRRHVPDVWNSAPQIWRWRDWIVNSLNADHGYDRMLQEMLAADEIRPGDDVAAPATGYLVRNWYALNPNDWMRNIVEHTGKAFLGLTINCAHCHDHKYDPIAQTDYFRFRAFFEPISIRQDRLPGQADPGPFQEYEYSKLRVIQRLGMVSIYDKTPDAPTWFYTGGDERNRLRDRGSIPPGLPAFLAAGRGRVTPVQLPPTAFAPGLRPALVEAIRQELTAAVANAEQKASAASGIPAEAPAEIRQQLTAAEARFETAAARAVAEGQPGSLAGLQSLLLDATSGRRVLQNRLTELKALPEDSTMTFQFQLLRDTHFNFQLARDVVKGLTAGYLGFDRGRIISYQPGTFTEFEAGRYDFAAGQTRFRVELIIQPAADRCLLTVYSIPAETLLVAAAPVALNGWNPSANSNQAISFDARTGSQTVVDDFVLTAGENVVAWDFESPLFAAEVDAVGIAGWEASPFSEAPAASRVSAIAGNPALRALQDEVLAARRAAEAAQLPARNAADQLAAAKAGLNAFDARVAAEQARVSADPPANIAELAMEANRLERIAALSNARANLSTAELAMVVAEARAADDPERPKQLESASKTLANARNAFAAAQTAASAPPAASFTPPGPEYPRTSTGRRKALAEAITAPNHPLTSRVAVNHIWLRHFHAPIVATVADFGRNGAAPTHPELLDWLAVEFVDSGWSMKHLHRLILTSETWQRAGSTDRQQAADDARARDPENRLFWRMNSGRMQAEVVRDSLLAVAGLLDLTRGGQELENSEALTTFRRSLYYAVYPEQGGRNELGELFDAPDPLDCYRRTSSIVPQQALALTNSELCHNVSSHVANRIQEAADSSVASGASVEAFINAAFELILCRSPSSAEMSVCREFLAADDAPAQRQSLVRALLNHNDFVTIR